MQLELNDVMAIILDEYAKVFNAVVKACGDDEQALRQVSEIAGLASTYTSAICRAIAKAENERVCSMLEGMEKYEFKTDDGEPAIRCMDCKHWDIPKKKCGAWDQRGSSGPCDLFDAREAGE